MSTATIETAILFSRKATQETFKLTQENDYIVIFITE